MGYAVGLQYRHLMSVDRFLTSHFRTPDIQGTRSFTVFYVRIVTLFTKYLTLRPEYWAYIDKTEGAAFVCHSPSLFKGHMQCIQTISVIRCRLKLSGASSPKKAIQAKMLTTLYLMIAPPANEESRRIPRQPWLKAASNCARPWRRSSNM